MSLTKRITAQSAAGYGINILELTPPPQVQTASDNVVGIVMHLPWGPYGRATVSSKSELYEKYAPAVFDVLDNYDSLKAVMAVSFPATIEVVRVEPSSSAAVIADFDFVDEDATESVTVTAKYAGVVGNQIKVQWIAGSTADTNTATAIVTIVTAAGDVRYSRTYVDVVTGGTTVTDPGDPYVTFSAHANIAKAPDAIAATALTGGTDGTAVAADWTGTVGTNFDGVAAFTSVDTAVDVVFGAEVPSAMTDAFNVQLIAAAENRGFFPVKSTPPGQTKAEAIAYVNDATSGASTTGRGSYQWPRVKVINFFSSAQVQPEVVIDGNCFMAAAIASSEPNEGPHGGVSQALLTLITGLETPVSRADLDQLNAAQVNTLVKHRGSYQWTTGFTITPTSGLEFILRRRMTDVIAESIANFLANFLGKPLDIDLQNRRTGPVTATAVGGVRAYLQGLKGEEPGTGIIKNYRVLEFTGSEAQLDAGTWPLVIEVELFAPLNNVILIANIGPTVTITEA